MADQSAENASADILGDVQADVGKDVMLPEDEAKKKAEEAAKTAAEPKKELDVKSAMAAQHAADDVWRGILDTEGTRLVEDYKLFDLPFDADTLEDFIKRLTTNNKLPLTELVDLAESIRGGQAQMAKNTDEFREKLEVSLKTFEDAQAEYDGAMLRKKKKDKKNEVDPNECKLWISWDSMYRRVKLGKWIGLSCSADQTCKIWDLTKVECRGTLSGQHEDTVKCAVMDTESKAAITGGMDGTLIKWNIESSEAEEMFLSGKFGAILTVECDFKKNRAITGCASGTVVLWDAQKLAPKGSFEAHEGSRITVCKADFKANRAITASDADGRFRVWDLETETCIGNYEGKFGGICRVAHVDWQKMQVISGSAAGCLYHWDINTCEEIGKLWGGKGHQEKITSIAVDPTMTKVVSTCEDETAIIWDAKKRRQVGKLNGHIQSVRDVKVDWKNNVIATCSDDTSVRIWDYNTQECTQILEGHMDRVTMLRARFDRNMLLSASDDYTIRIWDLEYMQEEGTLYGHSGKLRAMVTN